MNSCELAVALGKSVWGKTLAKGLSVAQTIDAIANGTHGFPQRSDDVLGTSPLWMACFALWYDLGLPRVVLGHKHAASLMCTTMHASDVPELVAPWSAFMLDVPGGLIQNLDGAAIDRVLVVDIEDGERERTACAFVIPSRADVPVTTLLPSDSISELTGENSSGAPYEQLSARLIVGAVAELSSHRPAAESSPRCQRKTDPRGNPVTRTFELRRDVRVDCRPAVASYLTGSRGTAPTVQVLVRGHWKRQRFGVGRANSEWRQIEPYWRGPEDAPIALRAHRIGGP